MRFLTSHPSAVSALVASLLTGASAQTPAGFHDGTDVFLHMAYGNTQILHPGGQYQSSDVAQPPSFGFTSAKQNQYYTAIILEVEFYEPSQPYPSAADAYGEVFLSYIQTSLRAVGNSTLLTSGLDPLVPFAGSDPTSTEGRLILALLYEQPSPFLVPETLLDEFYEVAECEDAREEFDLYSFLEEANLCNPVAAVYLLIGESSNSERGRVTTTATKTVTISGSPESLFDTVVTTLPSTSSTSPGNVVSLSQPTGYSTNNATGGQQPTSITDAAGRGRPTTSQPLTASPQSTAGIVLDSGSSGGDLVDAGSSITLTITASDIKPVSTQGSKRLSSTQTGGSLSTQTGGLTVTAAAGKESVPAILAAVGLVITAVVYWTFL